MNFSEELISNLATLPAMGGRHCGDGDEHFQQVIVLAEPDVLALVLAIVNQKRWWRVSAKIWRLSSFEVESSPKERKQVR